MQLFWPPEEPVDDLTRAELQPYGELLGFEAAGMRLTSFACVLAATDEAPKYAGRVLLLRRADGTAVAIARRAFERYVVAVHGSVAAHALDEQVRWLREAAPGLQPENDFQPIFLVSPGPGGDGLAIAGPRFKNVEYVVSQGANAPFDLISFPVHMESMRSRSNDRIAAIDIALRDRTDGFEGLPA